MHGTITVFKRELASYFTTPVAYVFICIFLALTGALTFHLGNFFNRGQADLQPFFSFHPWLYLLLIPAVSMRLWAEERKTGTIELFLTLPIAMWQAVLGKYLAAWAFTGIALALTFPIWLTVNYLGEPDNGVIVASYIGSFLMAGAFLAIGSAVSATTKNQVVAFVVACTLCFLFTVSGSEIVLSGLSGWAPLVLVETVSSFSFLTRFSDITNGVIDVRSLLYFLTVIALFLFANMVFVEANKAR